ncbi:hypothetical protein KR054_000753 [Drosophila jambulina]|nr:hypothetical protein KR054_000753 [Drosophila jambulina]
MELSEDTKERLRTVINALETTIFWGFIPLVLFLGFRRGADPEMPPLTILSLLWQ